MPMKTIQEIRNPPTRSSWLNEMVSLARELKAAVTNWSTFGTQRAIYEIVAEAVTRTAERVSELSYMGYNATATGDALTLLSDSHYDNQRVDATRATGEVELSLLGDEGPYDIAVGDMVITDGTYTFTNTQEVHLDSTDRTQTVVFKADEVGAEYNIPSDSQLTLKTTYTGVTAKNPIVQGFDSWLTSLGSDEEGDERLRKRNETKWATLATDEGEFQVPISQGIEHMAYASDPDITDVLVIDDNPRGPGTVDIIIAGELATATPEMVENAYNRIRPRFFGPDGYIQVHSANEKVVPLVGTIWYTPTYTAAQAQTAVIKRVDEFIASVPIGGQDFSPGPKNIVSLNDVIKEIEDLLEVRKVTLSSPVGDIGMGARDKLVKGPNTYTNLMFVRAHK